jgi:hypothetical protein
LGADVKRLGPTLARDEVPWRRLYHEGFRIDLGGELPEGVVFVAPFTETRECVVLMIPCPAELVERVRSALLLGATTVRSAGGLLRMVLGGQA